MATQSLGTTGTVGNSTLASADAILKEYYPSAIVEQLNQKTYLLDQIDRDTDSVDFTGRRAIIPVHKNRNRGRASFVDGGVLPNAGVQSYDDAIVNIRYHASAIELTDAAIATTKSNEGAFVSLLEAETKGVAQDLKKDINRQVFGTGDGVLATCSNTTAGTTIAVDSVQYLQVGDTISFGTIAGSTFTQTVATRTITARDATNKTITISGASITPTTSTKIVLDNGYGGTSAFNEMDGLRNISATTSRTLHGINSATAGNEYWNPQVISSVGSITEDKILQLFDKVAATGQAEVDVALTTRGIRRVYAATLTGQKRFNDAQAMKLQGGYSAIMCNDVPIVIDDDCPKGHLFALNKKAFKWFELAKPGFLEQDSGGIFTLKDGATAGSKQAIWQAFFRWYAAFGCVAPNRTGALTGVTDENPS